LPGPTSHDIVDQVRKILKIRKVGHAGTLDPFAEGVLLIMTEKDTKKSEELMHQEKEYIGEIKLGFISDTFDKMGIIKPCNQEILPKKPAVEKTLKNFRGEIKQVPPMFSAIKIKGKKLYELARKGIEIERAPRKIKILKLDLIDYTYPILKIRVICSSGTYIRSLANDIGETLKCGGYLESLSRVKIGEYQLSNSIKLSDLIDRFS